MAGFSVDAVVLKQKGHELYCFGMNTTHLKRICYVTPRSHDDPEEIQRIIKPARARQIGEYIQQANSLLPNSLVVSLTEDVTVSGSGNPNTKVINFPDLEGKFAYILDGQHRLEGFKYSEGVEFDLPVVALHNADEALRAKVFVTSTANKSASVMFSFSRCITRSETCHKTSLQSWTSSQS